MRLPSCGESFWVDELHSAWCVWGDLGDVFPRAAAGHQTPFYFYGLWGWKQLFGGSEHALRMTSVLAVSSASALLCVGLGFLLRSVAAGVISGLVLALESNAIFFGTELRPYAWIILASAVCVVGFARLTTTQHRSESPWGWGTLAASIAVAALLQPTSLGVLLWLPCVLVLLWLAREGKSALRPRRADFPVLASVVVLMLGLWVSSLGRSWQQRAIWAAFASTDSVKDLWRIWDWIPLLAAPLVIVGLAAAVSPRSVRRWAPTVSCLLITLPLIAVGCAGVYWLLARMGWLPVWHRRYMVALLPVFAAISGTSVAAVLQAYSSDLARPGRHHQTRFLAMRVLPWVVGAGLLAFLTKQQRVLPRLLEYPAPVVLRGEDWRSAAAYVADTAEGVDLVLVDAGLIEARRYLASSASPAEGPTREQLEYLVFPLLGPYRVGHHVRIKPIRRELSVQRDLISAGNGLPQSLFLISRRPQPQLERAAASMQQASEVPVSELMQVRGFGFVAVAKFRIAPHQSDAAPK